MTELNSKLEEDCANTGFVEVARFKHNSTPISTNENALADTNDPDSGH